MKILPVVVLALFLAAGLCAQQPPDGKAASAAASKPQNSNTSGVPSNGNVEVLSDTQGVDFGPYLSKVVEAVRGNWYTLIPEEAKRPELKSGNVSIEFAILSDGHIAAMKITHPSGDIGLDRAAWGGITASVPFPPLPEEYKGPFLRLRFRFSYNPKKGPAEDPTKDVAH
jgi:TonB family protein